MNNIVRIKKAVLIIAIIAAAAAFSSYGFAQADRSLERNDLIRLHVIANSDSPDDQALKLKVRDRLLQVFGDTFKAVGDIEDARALVSENIDELERTASEVIYQDGYRYNVSAQLGVFPFPTKVYGNTVYPAGNYMALRVVIGEGRGANWWCVMFPPLCFVDVSGGIARRPADEDTGADSIPEDTSKDKPDKSPMIATDDDGAQKVEYRFKIAEIWSGILNWLKKIFS